MVPRHLKNKVNHYSRSTVVTDFKDNLKNLQNYASRTTHAIVKKLQQLTIPRVNFSVLRSLGRVLL